jgi:putative transposase
VGTRVGTRGAQPVSYNLRLPDTAQVDALRLLGASRAVINQVLTTLWPHLDEGAAERSGPAWKHVDALVSSPEPQGSRQWRCEAEMVGRLLRAQAARKQIFAQVVPLLSAGSFVPRPRRGQPARSAPSSLRPSRPSSGTGLGTTPASWRCKT